MEKQKIDNKFLLEKQLETLKLFLERNLITKEQYEYEVQVLTTKIKIEEQTVKVCFKQTFIFILNAYTKIKGEI